MYDAAVMEQHQNFGENLNVHGISVTWAPAKKLHMQRHLDLCRFVRTKRGKTWKNSISWVRKTDPYPPQFDSDPDMGLQHLTSFLDLPNFFNEHVPLALFCWDMC